MSTAVADMPVVGFPSASSAMINGVQLSVPDMWGRA